MCNVYVIVQKLSPTFRGWPHDGQNIFCTQETVTVNQGLSDSLTAALERQRVAMISTMSGPDL